MRSAPLAIDVALTPALIVDGDAPRTGGIFIVVDVIRATTSLCLFFARGCETVLVAPSVAAARELRQHGEAGLLAGEVAGARPPGFDLGNSPAEIANADLAGQRIIFATTNGTRALEACARLEAGAILAGAFRNAGAVADAAIAAWRQQVATTTPAPDITAARPPTERDIAPADIVVVCSSREGYPAYDDTLCAGYLVGALQRAATDQTLRVTLHGGARIALAMAEHELERAPLRDLLESSGAARGLRTIGLGGDVAWCAEVDATTQVPRVVERVVARDTVGSYLRMAADAARGAGD